MVATAGGDGVVAVYDSGAGRLLSELRGHTKKVNGEHAPLPAFDHGAPRSNSSMRRSENMQDPARTRGTKFAGPAPTLLRGPAADLLSGCGLGALGFRV